MIFALLILSISPGCHRLTHPHHPDEVFDAGAVFGSTTPILTHVFRVQNTTGRSVSITGESHSCDCATADLSTRQLSPGDSLELSLSVHVPLAHVRKDVVATLETDDPEHPNWEYHILFEAFPDVRIVPQVIDLGSHTASGTPALKNAVDAGAREAWLELFAAPKGKDHPAPKLQQVPAECIATLAQAPEVTRLANGVLIERYRLSVRLKGGMATTGIFVRPLHALLPDGRGTSVTLTWSVRASIAGAPERIHLGFVAPEDAPIKRSVVLRSTDGTPFRIAGVEHDPFLAVRPREGGGFPTPASNRQALELVFRVPHEERGRFLAGAVRIRTDRGDCPEVSLPWSALLRTREGKSAASKGEGPSNHL